MSKLWFIHAPCYINAWIEETLSFTSMTLCVSYKSADSPCLTGLWPARTAQEFSLEPVPAVLQASVWGAGD